MVFLKKSHTLSERILAIITTLVQYQYWCWQGSGPSMDQLISMLMVFIRRGELVQWQDAACRKRKGEDVDM